MNPNSGETNIFNTLQFNKLIASVGLFYMIVLSPFADGSPARIITGTDSESTSPLVHSFTVRTHTTVGAFFAYNSEFTGGVRVASGDVNGDGVADIITGAGPGGLPHVKVFSGLDSSVLHNYSAYATTFAGGVFVASGDVNGDGTADIITGAGTGGAPHVKVFNGSTLEVLHDFFAFEATFQGGIQVASGDVNGDGRDDIIVGAGPGAIPHVKVFNGLDHSEMDSFLAYPATFNGGVNVAVGDVNGDGFADIITGAGAGGGPHVKVFDFRTGEEIIQFFSGSASFTGGVRVATGDVTGDGIAEIITSPGSGGTSVVRIFDAATQTELSNFLPYDTAYTQGAFVAVVPVTRPKLQWGVGRLNQNIVFRWPVTQKCVLAANKDLNDTRGWQAVEVEPQINGEMYEVEISIEAANFFYRLNCDDEQIPPTPQ